MCNALNSWKLCIFYIIEKCVSYYSYNLNLLSPKPKLSFRHLKQGILQLHEVLALADKASNNAIVVWRLYYTNTLKSELITAKTYALISTDEKSVANKHCNDIVVKFGVSITETQEKLPTFYWLPKLNKRSYKARFIANSSSCTATSLSYNHWIKYCIKRLTKGKE